MPRTRWSCLAMLVLALIACGCVTRTTTRQKRLSEMSPGNTDGHVVTRKTIWIWQPEFWKP